MKKEKLLIFGLVSITIVLAAYSFSKVNYKKKRLAAVVSMDRIKEFEIKEDFRSAIYLINTINEGVLSEQEKDELIASEKRIYSKKEEKEIIEKTVEAAKQRTIARILEE